MYGQSFLPYDQLLLRVLQWCDWQLETDVFTTLYPEVLVVHENFQPFDDVIPALKAFKEKGWKIGLMSNTTEKLMAVHRKALADLADLWLCAEDTQCYKPDLHFFQQAQSRWNLADAIHLHIAKGYWWDMIPAASMNWHRIWVNREQQPLNSSQPQPDLCVLSLNELADTDLTGVFEDETGHPLDSFTTIQAQRNYRDHGF